MQLSAQMKDGSVGSLEKEPRKQLTIDVAAVSPSSPGSPGKSAREKPVKVLPCPRCESMNTKFCYYNNYSVNQPRHFCRQCQRYWTVGGTLRNVPVGGGSRKKNRHQRGDPYLRTSPGSGNSPLAMGSSGSGHSMLQNVGFHQLLTQDLAGLNFSQLPGYVPPQNHFHIPFSLDQSQGVFAPGLNKPVQQDLSSMHAMYGTGAMSSQEPVTGTYYTQDLGSLQGENPGNVGVKTEFWGNALPQQQVAGNQGLWEQARHTSAASQHNVIDDEGKVGRSATPQTLTKTSGGYDTNAMFLHLGLNTRPLPMSVKPLWDPHTKSGHQTNGSPPHGSSTIEEEGSTPTNGYSNSGYEEGDTVSSMWHDMHDMQDIFQ